MKAITLKAIGIWLLILVAAILNGLVRDGILTPLIGPAPALPLSGVTLSLFIFLITWLLIPTLGMHPATVYISVGLFWVALTLSFEYLFGYFVAGKSWDEIIEVLNVTDGNLFIIAVLATAVAPWLTAKMRGIISSADRDA